MRHDDHSARPVPAPCSITTEDGAELSAPSDVRLAWQWAEHEHGREWEALSYGERCREASAALAELRRAASASSA